MHLIAGNDERVGTEESNLAVDRNSGLGMVARDHDDSYSRDVAAFDRGRDLRSRPRPTRASSTRSSSSRAES